MQRLTVQVWDTAGQEQFHSLTATYYRKAGGVMIVYDAHVRSSFDAGSVMSRSSYDTRVSWESHSTPQKLLPAIV